MMKTPLVSISCITYNHESYIRECLDGFLMQETNFPFEVLIHDDASTDKTADIIREYEAKYPDIIKPIYQTENQWSKRKGGINIRFNFNRAQGKYIAMCEGDDYWTDPLKLQKQVDFLEANEDCIYVFHKVQELKAGKFRTDELNDTNKTHFNLDDIYNKNYAHTPSIVFRATDFSKFPSFYFTAMPGDHTLQKMLLRNGGYANFMEDVMAVYRRHDGGIWSTDNGASYKVETTITRINLNKYFKKKNFSLCYPLADYVAKNGFEKVSFFNYYRLIFSQMRFSDIFNPKNKYLLFPWVYYLVKK